MRTSGPAALALLVLCGCALDHEHVGAARAVDPLRVPVVSAASLAGFDAASLAERRVLRVASTTPGLRARIEAAGATIASWHPGSGLATVTGIDAPAAARLARLEGVLRVAPDVLVSVDEPTRVPALAVEAESGDEADPSAAPAFGQQWHLRVIRADEAWEANMRGSARVTVAVLDTGLDYDHPDLAGRVDLSRSASFVPSDDALVEEHFPGRHPVTDLHFHGTHVGATISSNAALAAGVTSGVTLVGVKVLGADGKGPLSGVLEGVLHAADAGADVINMSLGSAFDPATAPGLVEVIDDTMRYAHDAGVLVVVSAGNDALDMDDDGGLFNAHCDSPTVVCVTATGPEDDFADYSNFGSAVDVSAPGGSSQPVWAACPTTSLRIPDCAEGDPLVIGATGTSMASPHVAGLSALLVSNHGREPDHLLRMLQVFSDDLGDPGHDPRFGRGRIDMAAALGLDLLTIDLTGVEE